MYNYRQKSSGFVAVFLYVAAFWTVLLNFGFSLPADILQLARQTQSKLSFAYDADVDKIKAKKQEITVTEDGFFRLRKIYTNGRQEYFSFNLSHFKSISYLGNTGRGIMNLTTNADDIIVQTYNDPKGDIDSMASFLAIPLKRMEAEDMVEIQNNLLEIKRLLAAGRQAGGG